MRLQARWDMVLQWASVLLLPRLCWQQNIISLNLLLSITIPMDSLPTADLMEGVASEAASLQELWPGEIDLPLGR